MLLGIPLLILSLPITAFGLFACGYADSGLANQTLKERMAKFGPLVAGLGLGTVGATLTGVPLVLSVPIAAATAGLGFYLVMRPWS